MDIKREVSCGNTLEGNASVTVKPNDEDGIKVEYTEVSGVMPQYAIRQKKKVEDFVQDACVKYDIKDAHFIIEDCVSYDCTIKSLIDETLQKAIV